MAPRESRASPRAGGAGALSETREVLIVEEYVPDFRRRFFELLASALDSESIRLTVATGVAPTAVTARNDAVTGLAFAQSVTVRSVTIAGRRLTFKRLSQLAADASLVVVDQALRHLESYPLLLRQRRGPKVALWGHGTRHAKPATRLERLLERRITTSAHWFFTYTQRGAELVAASGFPRERITVVQNTFDVGELAELRESVSGEEQRQLRDELDLPSQNVCLYIGALDASKRIGFLLEACAIVASRIPDFALVVAGDGPERHVVQTALAFHPWLRYVGRSTGRRKARLGAVSDVLLMPGSVGLVAVDSFALQTPIITTRWPYHGPEADYLANGVNARITRDSVEEFAQVVQEVLLARDELARLKVACAAATAQYSLEKMVTNFTGGVIAALRMPLRRT